MRQHYSISRGCLEQGQEEEKPQSRGTASTPAAAVQVADAAIPVDDNEQMETIEAEVQAATTALKRTEDRFEDDNNADDSDQMALI